ncbi:MAG TPA: tyrosine-protein phosphatase [Lichenihabitans sp.]|jgi:protein tyrosine/serine phosphatase|nr:tyrosine-protein phosphatase [Lichenihabitans sp.]
MGTTWLFARARRSIGTAVIAVVALGAACGGWAGYLRITGNIHEIEPGVFRSAQLGADKLVALIDEHHIKTVLNLRGNDPGEGWYDAEAKAVHDAGARYVSIGLSDSHEPDPATLAKLVDALKTAPKPLLLHCAAGADRAGLASAIYEFLVMHRPPAVADEQLSFRYGHFPWLISRTGAMDRTFERVVSETN